MNLYYVEYTCQRVGNTQVVTEFFQAENDTAALTEVTRQTRDESNCTAADIKLFRIGVEVSIP
jgi:hypothetical protein